VSSATPAALAIRAVVASGAPQLRNHLKNGVDDLSEPLCRGQGPGLMLVVAAGQRCPMIVRLDTVLRHDYVWPIH